MKDSSKSGIVGAGLIGLGCALTAVGIALVVPACTNWSLSLMDETIKRGRGGLESAASLLGEFTGRAQHRFDEAAKAARTGAAKAAGAVETAARHVREYAS
jgi:hypothetical protein